MRVDGDNPPKAVMSGHFREHNRRAAFETPDLNDASGCRRARSQQTEESRLVFEKQTGHGACRFPGFV